ncbi:hypothetical protein GFC01_16325 [Desulfofundulus thermobenzoicus]|uniref:Uncharacterized protein n=1 Tax=Desulfofundulus thermobenzoicus TaxID=29376 RepID=A0A6N7IUN8_9FIRM|nr:hypothetical protein [Desulfofundulus thermobenzoicus]MQL53792.1 hypothetical protein [Desulfofundulus thermobenzoicus]
MYGWFGKPENYYIFTADSTEVSGKANGEALNGGHFPFPVRIGNGVAMVGEGNVSTMSGFLFPASFRVPALINAFDVGGGTDFTTRTVIIACSPIVHLP